MIADVVGVTKPKLSIAVVAPALHIAAVEQGAGVESARVDHRGCPVASQLDPVRPVWTWIEVGGMSNPELSVAIVSCALN